MDFCQQILSPKISANKPALDGAEVTNLISNGIYKSEIGFICEGFVRTPVDIEIEFPLPIDIARIELNTAVNRRHSKGISILADFSEEDQKILKEDSLISLGKWFLKNESKVILKNYNYKHWLQFSLPILSECPNTYQGVLRHPSRLPLTPIKRLIVRILAVTPSGPPVLQSIQIWGQPSLKANTTLRKKFIKKWMIATQISKVTNNKNSNIQELDTLVNNNCNVDSKEIKLEDFPEDFLDPLTFEVMSVPILLPSGNSIDLKSLERFIANEGTWGRPASDPFTGIIFKEGYKPEPNVLLKARIDRFLLLNNKSLSSDILVGLGRTLGSSLDDERGLNTNEVVKRKQSLNTNEVVKRKHLDEHYTGKKSKSDPILAGESSSGVKLSNDISINQSVFSSLICEKKNISSLPPKVPNKIPIRNKAKNTHNLVHTLGTALSQATKSSSVHSKCGSLVTLKTKKVKYNVENPSSEDTELKSSDTVHSVGSSKIPLPRPSSVKCGGSSTAKETFTVDSLTEGSLICSCGQKGVLYKFKCSHLMCRPCLITRPHLPLNVVQCNVCGKMSQKGEIQRIHNNSIFQRNSK